MTELHITPQLPEYPKIAQDVFMLLLDGKLRSRTETLKFLKPLGTAATAAASASAQARESRKGGRGSRCRSRRCGGSSRSGAGKKKGKGKKVKLRRLLLRSPVLRPARRPSRLIMRKQKKP